jgi:S1-C subfamily serine protease
MHNGSGAYVERECLPGDKNMQKWIVPASLFVLIHAGLAWWPRAESSGPSNRMVRCSQQCQDRQLQHLEPVSIEDQQIERQLVEQGGRLIEAGQTVDMQVLIGQLRRRSCRLQLPPAESSPRDPVQLYRAAKEAVVVVAGLYKCRNCARWHATSASGFAISSRGAIATNHHVVDDPNLNTLVVMTADQRVYPVQEVVAASQADDVAILKISAEDLVPLPLAADRSAAPVGSDVHVVSHPDGKFYCYTSGIISRHTKIPSAGHQVDATSITADYARGSSGAPVLNRFGQVVAIVMSTESVYYSENSRYQRDLQMVFKTCIPSVSLRKLIREDRSDPVAATPLASS